MWDEVSRLNASFTEVIQELHEDLKLAERLQKSRLPQRFPDLKGMKVASRYAAGARSGGDHFDLAESKDGNTLSMVLTDSSSYGLSSAVLGALMRVANRLSADESRSSIETVRKIREEILATLKEKDRLSLFYGVLSRKDYRLRYLNLGTSCAFYAAAGKGFEPLRPQGAPITRASGELEVKETELSLQPGSRLVLISDGFVEALEGPDRVRELLDQLRAKEASDSLNELTFKLKASYRGEDDVPPQDCTGVVLDLDSRLIRLAG
jgi:serine phosphatase RsbU (regulator of sigma subunit)